MGRDDGIAAILRDVDPAAGRLRRGACRTLLPAVETAYRVDPGPPMVRMWVDRAHFRPYPADRPAAAAGRDRRAQPALPARLRVVAAVARDRRRRLLRRPRQRPARRGGRDPRRSAATARLAVVGNVLTHVDYRGRGFATAVTGAVTAELLRIVRPGRPQRPRPTTRPPSTPTAASATPSTSASRSGSSTGSARRGRTSPAPLRRLFTRKETDPR